MTPTRHLEREVKLGAALDLELPDLRDLLGGTTRLPEEHLSTAYFDTEDLRLWERGMTLRHRRGENGGENWTLKLPSGHASTTLDREELSWLGSRERVPDPARRVVSGIVRGSELKQIAVLTTTRLRMILRDASGDPFGELDDDRVAVDGGSREGRRFRQLEIELTGDAGTSGSELLEMVVQRLKAAGAEPETTPKLAMALGSSSVIQSRSPPGPSSTLGQVVSSSIADGLNRLLDHDYRLRLAQIDPDQHDAHQARVATRRLRSNLKTLALLLDPVWLGHTRDELRWLGNALGGVRDLDVLGEALKKDRRELVGDPRSWDALLARLDEERSIRAAELAEALENERYFALLDRLHAAIQRPPFFPADHMGHRMSPRDAAKKRLRELIHPEWRKLRSKVRRSGKHPSDHNLHRIRIKAKQLRYASELAEPVLGKSARRTAEAAKALQTVLGDHQDAVVAQSWLRNVAQHEPGAGFAAGQASAASAQRQRAAKAQWHSDWRNLRKQNRY